MGMVSFLDDIQKVRDDAFHFRRLLISNASFDRPVQELADEARQKIPGFLSLLDSVIAHFDKILEIATDPSMDMAEEIVRLKSKIATLEAKHDTQIEFLQRQIEAQKSAADSSQRNFRDELKKRDNAQKEKIAEITKSHVRELENQKRAHQIEKNGWLKELQECKRGAIANEHRGSKTTEAVTKELDFASALRSFEPEEDDVR